MIKRLIDIVLRHEILRFGIVGGCAAAIHYGCYLVLLTTGLAYNGAYVISFLISFSFNFTASNYFTFRTKPSFDRALMFAASHGINLLNQMIILNILIYFGVDQKYAPPVVFVLAFPISFFLVRYALKILPKRFRKDNTI